MSFLRQLTRGIRTLTNRTATDRELENELQHYVEQAAAAHAARGLSPEEALRAAHREVGNTLRIKEQVSDYGWENVIRTFFIDLCFAGRMLRKSPVFTVVVVLVTSLGSGAVTTILSGMDALVVRPLPGVTEAAELVTFDRTGTDGTGRQQASYRYYEHVRSRAHALDGVGAWSKVSLTISSGVGGTSVFGNMVSGNFFEVLGVRPALGRFFAAHEDRTPLTDPVIVVSHGFWKTRLAADPGVIGHVLRVNGRPFTLIGVTPPDFRGVLPPIQTDAWIPLMMQPQLRPQHNLTDKSWLWLFGRLRDGAGTESVRRELIALTAEYAAVARERPGAEALTDVRVARLTALPEELRGVMLGFMGLLLGAAALVLLIAVVNVASMFSARSIARQREMAVRTALGAGRTRLLRQLMTEIVGFFLLGGLGGVVIAIIAAEALERITLPASVPVPLTLQLSPDFRTMAIGLGIAVLTGLIFGVSPALRAASKDVASCLRVGAGRGGVRRTLLGRALIVGQLALALVLLVAAGLFLRALERGVRMDPGFDWNTVVAASFEPNAWGYDPVKAQAFYRNLRERIQPLSGVAAVSYTGNPPLSMRSSIADITVDGVSISIHTATADAAYFSALRLPLMHGRPFAPGDDERAPKVAIVNEVLARRLSGDGNAVGRTFRFREARITVVGVARNAAYAFLDEETPAFAYLPLAQWWEPNQTLLVRTTAESTGIARTIQEVIRTIDPALPRINVVPLRQANALVLLPQRVAGMVTGALGAVGLLLAAVGLYGQLAYSASQRTREIGIRLALGAQRGSVLGMMVRDGLGLAGLGLIVGLLLAAAVTPLMRRWLLNVSPFDGLAFGSMSLLFLSVALLAAYLPARRAAGADPLAVLRAD